MSYFECNFKIELVLESAIHISKIHSYLRNYLKPHKISFGFFDQINFDDLSVHEGWHFVNLSKENKKH